MSDVGSLSHSLLNSHIWFLNTGMHLIRIQTILHRILVPVFKNLDPDPASNRPIIKKIQTFFCNFNSYQSFKIFTRRYHIRIEYCPITLFKQQTDNLIICWWYWSMLSSLRIRIRNTALDVWPFNSRWWKCRFGQFNITLLKRSLNIEPTPEPSSSVNQEAPLKKCWFTKKILDDLKRIFWFCMTSPKN